MEARVPVRVRGAGEREAFVQALVDTGFSGDLMLPFDTVEHLRLRATTMSRMFLGDGSSVLMPVYDATVEWHGGSRRIDVFACDSDPLIGMSLLRGSRLELDAVPDGPVRISPLP
jgi:clan AA aspartic protease